MCIAHSPNIKTHPIAPEVQNKTGAIFAFSGATCVHQLLPWPSKEIFPSTTSLTQCLHRDDVCLLVHWLGRKILPVFRVPNSELPPSSVILWVVPWCPLTSDQESRQPPDKLVTERLTIYLVLSGPQRWKCWSQFWVCIKLVLFYVCLFKQLVPLPQPAKRSSFHQEGFIYHTIGLL